MCALFESGVPQPVEPVAATFPKIIGAEIAGATFDNRAAGDFYDCFRVGDERILFGLLDLAGRRDDNRQVLEAAQKMFRSLGSKLFSPPDLNESQAMVELCLELNRAIMEESSGVHSCPAFIGCYHERLGTVCYTNAGHLPGLLRDSTGVAELSSTGLPLGLFSHATCDAPTVGMEKGAALLLVSRGVVERISKSESGEENEFGLERTKEFLRSDASHTAYSLCTAVLQAVGSIDGNARAGDDMTALALMRTT
jgi:phosphoserine phosphatase RsbU/P